MKKTNSLLFLMWCLFLVACSTQETPTPELKGQRGDPLCILDPFGNCIPQGGNNGGNTGNTGNNSNTSFKVYMSGQSNDYHLNQGYSNNGFDWLSQGTIPIALSTIQPSAVKFNGDILVFYADDSNFAPFLERVLYARSSDGGQTWPSRNIPFVNETAYTSVGTSAVEFEGKIYFAYNDINGNNTIKILTFVDGNYGIWTPHSSPVTTAENRSDGEPSLVVHNNELYIFYVSHSGRVKYKKKNPFPSSGWGNAVDVTAEVNGNDVNATGGVTAVSFNNTIHIIYKANNNYLLAANALSLGTIQGHYVNNARSSGRPSVAADDSKMVLLYKGNTSNSVFYSTSNDGQTWLGNAFAVGNTRAAPYVITND